MSFPMKRMEELGNRIAAFNADGHFTASKEDLDCKHFAPKSQLRVYIAEAPADITACVTLLNYHQVDLLTASKRPQLVYRALVSQGL